MEHIASFWNDHVMTMLRGLDLKMLRIAIAIHEERSATLAAKRLGISQPTVSKALAKLRTALGDQLFVKTSHGMEPTAKADWLVIPAREMFSRLENNEVTGTAFDPATTKATLTFAFSEVGEMLFFPDLVKRLRIVAPLASIVPVSPPVDEIRQGLESGDIDLAIGYLPDLKGNHLFRQRLFVGRVVCLLRADHPIHGKQLSREQYVSLGHVVVRSAEHSNSIFKQVLGGQKKRQRVMLSTSHYLTLPRIIQSTDLVATVIRPIGLYLAAKNPHLKVLTLPSGGPKLEVQQFWHRKFQDLPKNKWLRALVKELFSEERELG